MSPRGEDVPLDWDVEDALRTLIAKPAFRNITLRDFVPIVRRGHRKMFPKNAPLMEHGRHSESLHLILKGTARVERTFGLNRPQFIAELGPGDLVGEMGSFSGIARSATVTALDDVDTLEWTERELQRVLQHDNPLMVALVRIINERYKST